MIGVPKGEEKKCGTKEEMWLNFPKWKKDINKIYS